MKNVKCYSCGGKGHFSTDCRTNPKDKKKIICYYCKDTGHIAPNCPKKKENGSGKVSFIAELESSPVKTSREQEVVEANTVESKNEHKEGWIVDSRATHHMCKDREVFFNTKEVRNGKKIILGNSSRVDVELEGQVDLSMSLGSEGKVTGTLKNVLYAPEMSRNLFL